MAVDTSRWPRLEGGGSLRAVANTRGYGRGGGSVSSSRWQGGRPVRDSPQRMDIRRADVLVIGTGGAGIRAAIAAAEAGAAVLVVGKRGRRDAHTSLAAGGMNGALATVDPMDTWEQHFADTVVEGYLLGDPRVAEIMAREAPAASWSWPGGGAHSPRTDDGRSTSGSSARTGGDAPLRGRLHRPGHAAHPGRPGRALEIPIARGAVRVPPAGRRRRVLRRVRLRPARRSADGVRGRSGRPVRRRPHALWRRNSSRAGTRTSARRWRWPSRPGAG